MYELELMIGPAELSYPAASDGAAVGRGGAYEYGQDRFADVAGPFLFWGPYLDLAAGVYVADFHGEVQGRLSLEFVHDSGRMRIKRIDLDDFGKPACIVLLTAVKGLEIRALKTQALERLRLEGIRIQCVYRAAQPR